MQETLLCVVPCGHEVTLFCLHFSHAEILASAELVDLVPCPANLCSSTGRSGCRSKTLCHRAHTSCPSIDAIARRRTHTAGRPDDWACSTTCTSMVLWSSWLCGSGLRTPDLCCGAAWGRSTSATVEELATVCSLCCGSARGSALATAASDVFCAQ